MCVSVCVCVWKVIGVYMAEVGVGYEYRKADISGRTLHLYASLLLVPRGHQLTIVRDCKCQKENRQTFDRNYFINLFIHFI